jgi:hypothetical protein
VSWWDRLVANRSVPTPRALVIQMYHELSASLLPSFYMAGTAVFATSGALAAARARQTPLTFAFFAVVTGIGGKTLSELLMGRQSLGSSSNKYRRLPYCRATGLEHTTRLVAQSRNRLVRCGWNRGLWRGRSR